jgi:hypothetical protein
MLRSLASLILAAACAIAAAEEPAPSPSVVGVVEAPHGRLSLYAEATPCVGDAKRAQWVPNKGASVTGCWTVHAGALIVVFLDGDVARMPVGMVRRPGSN